MGEHRNEVRRQGLVNGGSTRRPVGGWGLRVGSWGLGLGFGVCRLAFGVGFRK